MAGLVNTPTSAAHVGDEDSGAAHYVAAVRDHWLLITLFVLIAVLPTAAYSLTAPKHYNAEADLVVTPIPADDTTFLGINTLLRDSTQSQAVVTAGRLVDTPEVGESVKSTLGLRTRPSVDVKPLSQSNVVSIVASASTATAAAALANAYADAVIALRTAALQAEIGAAIDRLNPRLASLSASPNDPSSQAIASQIRQRLGTLDTLVGAQDPTLSVLARAVPPTSASWPRPALSVFVAFACSLLLGTGLALAIDLINPVVKDENELLFVHRLPILARLPRVPQKALRRFLTSREELPSSLREAYRMLRGALAMAGPQGQFPRVILVSSASAAEGKSVTAIYLANVIARSGMNVILVDGDLRNPMLAAVFGAPAGRKGLTDLLRGTTTLDAALTPGPRPNLRLLLSLRDPLIIDLLHKDRVAGVLAQLREHADVVVIDSSPLNEFADSYAFANAADAVILCVRLGRTRRDKVGDLLRRLSQLHIVPTGFVVIARKRTFAAQTYTGQRRYIGLPLLPEAGGDASDSGSASDGEAAAGDVVVGGPAGRRQW
jgi:capsular exopolysaccharide synthesis family protein